eukprot:1989814-Alexandrium_andersonii.AAC.1
MHCAKRAATCSTGSGVRTSHEQCNHLVSRRLLAASSSAGGSGGPWSRHACPSVSRAARRRVAQSRALGPAAL